MCSAILFMGKLCEIVILLEPYVTSTATLHVL